MEIHELVKKNDPQNQFDVIKKSYEQVEYSWNHDVDLSSINKDKINNIILTGLGGSAISGDLMINFLKDELSVPFSVNRNYNLPKYADENTLVICSSYSGNTEETISACRDAIEKNCQVICITTGGRIGEMADKNQFPVFKLKPGYQPRYALWINFFALLKSLHLLNLVQVENEFVENIIQHFKTKGNELSVEDNLAFRLAESLNGFVPVIYVVADVTSAVGVRLKCQFNENSKLHSYCSLLPELNHNEIIGWETYHEKQFNTKVIFIDDDTYHPQVKKRVKITGEILGKSGVEHITLKSDEKDFKLRLLDLIYLGDWISYYLAIIRNQDPSLIKNIIYLKEKLVE